LERLDEFKYLVNKKAFPEKYKEYLFELLKSKDKKFYEIMNKECEYPHKHLYPIPTELWNEVNVTLDVEYLYCAHSMTESILCDNCRFYLNIIKEYKE
jgi:hypothetical protein